MVRLSLGPFLDGEEIGKISGLGPKVMSAFLGASVPSRTRIEARMRGFSSTAS